MHLRTSSKLGNSNMSSEPTFRITFILLWIAFLAISFTRRLGQLGSRSIRKRFEEASKWEGKTRVALRAALAPFWLIAILLYMIYPDWIMQFKLPLSIGLRWTGVGLAIGSYPLLAWAIHALGEQFSPHLQMREEHKLVTGGPYRWMRHPMYTAESVFYIGLAVEAANWVVAPAILIGPALLYARVSKEEAMLIERFGDEYRAYMKSTGRFLPRFRRRN